MPSSTTPNMNLILPTVGAEPGPDYATDVNNSLSTVDSHDHSSGKGVPVTPAGLSITSDLTFINNNATNLRSIRFTAGSTLNGGSDMRCIYVSGVDLYYTDGDDNIIRLTQGGSIAGSNGNITGLVSPASVVYNPLSGVFTFESDTSTAGDIDAGSITIREMAANAKGVTLQSPISLAADYSITLPSALPGSQKFVTLDASGNMAAPWAVDGSTLEIASGTTLQVKDSGITTAKIADNAVTPAKLSAQNVGSVDFNSDSSTTSGTFVTLGSLVVSITVSGVRPVLVFCMPIDGTNPGYFGTQVNSGGSNTECWVRITRDDGTHWPIKLGGADTGQTRYGTNVIQVYDPSPSAGARTYTLEGLATTIAGDLAKLTYGRLRLIAYEL